jgi:hypothetical protein
MTINTKNSTTAVVGTVAASVLAVNGQRARLWVYALSTNTGVVYVTWDGTTPTSSNFQIELVAGAGILHDRNVPGGAVSVLGSASSQTYTVEEG